VSDDTNTPQKAPVDPAIEAPDNDATQFVAQTTPPSAASADEATWFAGAAPSAAPELPVAGTATGDKVSTGTLINNNYKVIETLSAGGMGEVYKGENVFTNDPVAIKVMLDKLANDAKASAMFMREAKTLSQLSDDAIVRYYNFVHDPGIDRFCLIMEFIQGIPLSDHVEQHGPVPQIAAETLLRRIARGLEKAHRSGVIHRDLSPDNVMLPSGIIAEARLIDFGIAKSIINQDVPFAEEFAGKFKFVAPEQLGHFDGVIGPKTDIYGLGLLISAAMIGKALPMGSSIEEAAQLRQSIPDLSALPPELKPLVAYMLEPNPEHRPKGMADVAHLLDNPHDIPDQYFDGPKPPPRSVTPAISRVGTVSGLALPPTQVQSEETSVEELHLDEPPNKAGGFGAIKMMFGLGVLMAAGLTGFAYSQGFFSEPAPTPNETATTEPSEQIENLLTPRQPSSRDGFLAEFDSGSCSYVQRVTTGSMAGVMAGYGVSDTFAGVPPAYEAQFGAAPALQFQQVTQDQCAVLDFTRSLQGRAISPAALGLESGIVASGDQITGTFTDIQGRNVWLALVSPQGRVYPITERLNAPLQGQQSFSLQLQLNDGSNEVPQLFLAVVSEQPLVTTAQIAEGVEAEVLLPRILKEITESAGQGTAALAHVMLRPSQQEPLTTEEGGDIDL